MAVKKPFGISTIGDLQRIRSPDAVGVDRVAMGSGNIATAQVISGAVTFSRSLMAVYAFSPTNLTTINGTASIGEILVLSGFPFLGTTVTAVSTGNLRLHSNYALNKSFDRCLLLMYTASGLWVELGRSP